MSLPLVTKDEKIKTLTESVKELGKLVAVLGADGNYSIDIAAALEKARQSLRLKVNGDKENEASKIRDKTPMKPLPIGKLSPLERVQKRINEKM